MYFPRHSLPFPSLCLLPVLQSYNDIPRCGLINTLRPDDWTIDSVGEVHWRSMFHSTNRWACSLWKGRCFCSSKYRACRRRGAGRGPFSLHALRICFTLGTHHISCLFIRKMVRSSVCVELVRPQAKNTFMCHDWGCHRMPIACIEMI